MSSSRFAKALAVGLFAFTIVLSSPGASALQRVDDPRDPIVRFLKYIKKVFTGITLDDGSGPPHP